MNTNINKTNYLTADDVFNDRKSFNNYLEVGEYILENNLQWITNNDGNYCNNNKKILQKWIQHTQCDPYKLVNKTYDIIINIEDKDKFIKKKELFKLLSLFNYTIEEYTELLDICGEIDTYDKHNDDKINKEKDFIKIIATNKSEPNFDGSYVLLTYILKTYINYDSKKIKKKIDNVINKGLYLFAPPIMDIKHKVILASLYPETINKITIDKVINVIDPTKNFNEIMHFRKYKNGIDFTATYESNRYNNIIYNMIYDETINKFDKLYLKLIDNNGVFIYTIQDKYTYKYLIEQYSINPNIKIKEYNGSVVNLLPKLIITRQFDIAKMLIKKGAELNNEDKIIIYNSIKEIDIIQHERIKRFIKKMDKYIID